MGGDRLYVSLLGWPEVRWVREDHNQVLTFPSLKSQALLYYLLIVGRPVARERLMSLLWPAADQSRAQTSLRTALYHLQRVLPSGALHADRQCVALGSVCAWETDVHRLMALLEEEPRCDVLREIRRLYRGDFLEGFHVPDAPEFALWRAVEAEHVRTRLLEWLHQGASRGLRQGTWPTAEKFLRFMLRLEPWREDFHRRLIEVLSWQGKYAAALKHLQVCRKTLEQELGVGPGKDLQQLAERVKALHHEPPPFHVPSPSGPTIGREVVLLQLYEAFENYRVVVLVGPGGVGKTHLLLAFAQRHRYRFRDGIYYVELDTSMAPDILVSQVAAHLGLVLKPGPAPERQILRALEERETLFLFDVNGSPQGFEHLLATWIQGAPAFHALVAVRTPLHLHAAKHIVLEGLSGPPHDEAPPRTYPAGRLFVNVAQRLGQPLGESIATYRAVARICRLLDGFPLALEIAAAQLHRWNITTLARVLEQNLDTLQVAWPDVPPRHQSLRSLFAHTWASLPQSLQRAFLRLAVFHGPFLVQDAVHVADVHKHEMEALASSGLLHRRSDQVFAMHDTLRAFALEELEERLDAESREALFHRHAQYYLERLVHLATSSEPESRQHLLAILPDVRAAWLWMAAHGCWSVIRQVLPLWHRIYEQQGWYAEGARLFLQTVQHLRPHRTADAAGWARLLLHTAGLLLRHGRLQDALALAQEGVERVRTIEEETPTLLFGLNVLGVVHLHMGDFTQGIRYLEEVVQRAREGRLVGEHIKGLVNLGSAYLRAGMYDRAIPLLREGLALSRRVGDRVGEGLFLMNLGAGLALRGDVEEGRMYLEAARKWGREHGAPNAELHALISLAALEGIHGGDATRVEGYARQAVDLARSLGERQAQARGMAWLAWAYHLQDKRREAWQILQEAWYLLEEEATPTRLYLVLQAAMLWAREGDQEKACTWAAYVRQHPASEKHLVQRADTLLQELKGPRTPPPQQLELTRVFPFPTFPSSRRFRVK